MAIGQMTVTLDKNNEVQAIQAICVGMAVRNLDHTIVTANGHGTGVTSKHIECTPPNDLAHGLIGHYGALVDGVGLECATFNFPK